MSTDHRSTTTPTGAGVDEPVDVRDINVGDINVGDTDAVRDNAGQSLGPVLPSDPIEMQLAVGALKAIAVLALPTLGFAWLAAGGGGLLGAGIGIAVVTGMYAISGAMLSFAAKLGPGALMAAALGGFGMRLMLYALLIVLLRPVEAIHGPSLAISAAVLLVLTLIWEARIVTRTPNLLWIDASVAHRRPVSTTESLPRPTPESTGHPA